jgi:hypothetical protein
MNFMPDQGFNTITFSETFHHALTVLMHPLYQVRRNANIKRAVSLACE